jgi:hypothetical protein
VHLNCGSEHSQFQVSQEKLDTNDFSVSELIYQNPEDKLIPVDFPCSRCIHQIPEHFHSPIWIANALGIARPIINRAKEMPDFINMGLRCRKYPSKFRLEGMDLEWLYNTRELVQLATWWMIRHEARNRGEEEVLRKIYNSYLEVVEYNLVADIEGTKQPDGTPEWFILLRGLSEIDTPEV